MAPIPASVLPRRKTESQVERMHRELQRALKKPVHQRRWVMVIDLR